jgi:AcrR family transcriptional regulator
MVRRIYSDEELRERAVAAAEELLRRHGPQKTRLVDVAKAIKVSHSVLYRVFPDREALMDAVSARWLSCIDDELGRIAASEAAPDQRLRAWFRHLHHVKTVKIAQDPGLWANYDIAAARTSPTVCSHVGIIQSQVASIIRDGIGRGMFPKLDIDRCVESFFNATMAFHHPRLVAEEGARERPDELDRILDLMLHGLRAQAAAAAAK